MSHNDHSDEYALIPRQGDAGDGMNPYLRFASADAIPEIYDIPIGLVNRVLYTRPEHPA